MKKFFLTLAIVLLPFLGLTAKKQVKKNLVIAYVTSWTHDIPDPNYMTHINYAFGSVNKTFDGVGINNPERLKQIVNLKQKNPKLKVLLSIGGWGSGGFSEMVTDPKTRERFCHDCLRVVNEFGLDGIDIDWEYPGNPGGGISHAPTDKENFSLLMKGLRSTLGKKRLVTLATAAMGGFYDFPAFIDDVDFVNMMTYDMGGAPRHHAPLFNSGRFHGGSCEKAMKAHLEQGVPAHKLTMGVPFYGRGNRNTGDFQDYRNITKMTQYHPQWDEDAKAPYLSDDEGNVVMGYDNPKSLKIKCEYIRKNHLLGVMYWDYHGDDENGSLQKALWNNMK